MSKQQSFQRAATNKVWADRSPMLFRKKILVFKSKETNSIFGGFDLMELKNNPEVGLQLASQI